MGLLDETNITAEEIAVEGLKALDSKYQKSIGFFAWDFFVAIGKLLYKLWEKVFYIANCLSDLSNMEYDDLVNFVYQTRGIKAKTATVSSGILRITNGAGRISAGAIFETTGGTQFKAISTKDVETNDTIDVECLTAGIVGNVPANSITIIPTTVAGIVAVTNETEFTNGYEAETKEDLLTRYYEDLQKPITSGNIYHYKKWAKEVSGVGDAKVKPLWNGDNTVKVVIIDSNKHIPPQSLVEQVQQYIDPLDKWGCGMGQAPIGAYCAVVGATAKNLTISVSVVLKSGADLNSVKTNIENAVNKYLEQIAFDEEVLYISYAKIGAIIMESDGVKDYSGMLLNNGTDNILLTDSDTTVEVAVLQELNISTIEG